MAAANPDRPIYSFAAAQPSSRGSGSGRGEEDAESPEERERRRRVSSLQRIANHCDLTIALLLVVTTILLLSVLVGHYSTRATSEDHVAWLKRREDGLLRRALAKLNGSDLFDEELRSAVQKLLDATLADVDDGDDKRQRQLAFANITRAQGERLCEEAIANASIKSDAPSRLIERDDVFYCIYPIL